MICEIPERVFKCKAYSKKYNLLLPPGFAMDSVGNICTDNGYTKEDHILLQYTELNDKNKTEVYEGDILYKEFYWKFYVGFKDGCFVGIPIDPVQRVNWIWQPVRDFINLGYIVIGNIYTNPELLEGDTNEGS